jgi:hypothetical protein
MKFRQTVEVDLENQKGSDDGSSDKQERHTVSSNENGVAITYDASELENEAQKFMNSVATFKKQLQGFEGARRTSSFFDVEVDSVGQFESKVGCFRIFFECWLWHCIGSSVGRIYKRLINYFK